MSKNKGKGPKQPSARGHREGNVIRWREKLQKYHYRIDENGNKIGRPRVPVNTFSKDWLSQYLLSPSVSGPPLPVRRDPPPDNVTSITKAREAKASKPVSQSGNEAEAKQRKNTCVHGWLHSKAEAISDFKNWERRTKEIGRNRCGSEPWVERNKKLSSPSLERAREAAQNGHKGLVKLRFKKPPSTVHNPFIMPESSGGYAPVTQAAPICVLNQRNRSRDDTYALAPSGIPISEFITGKYKPIESAVVCTTPKKQGGVQYTKEWPFVKAATPPPPPTATRHWYGEAANDTASSSSITSGDNSVKVRKTPGIRSDYMRLVGQVRWYIDNVDVQKWPMPMYRFVKFKPNEDKPVVDHDAIDKVAGDPQAELNVMKAMLHGMQRQYRMIDIALCDAQSHVNLLTQELGVTQEELRKEKLDRLSFEYQLAQQTGDVVSADTIRDEMHELNIIKAKTPVPDDVDSMIFMYNTYKAFARSDGDEAAFARYVWGDPALGKVMRDHADMKASHRAFLCDERGALHRIGMNVRERNTNAGYVKYPEIKRFREQAALVRIKHKVKAGVRREYERWWELRLNSSTYYSRLMHKRLERDLTMIRHWGTEATPFNRKKPVNYQQVINDVVGVRSVEYSSPSLVLYFKKLGFEYKKYMNQRAAKYYLSLTWKGKVVNTVNKAIKFLNTEVNPSERKRMKEEAILRKEAKAERKKRKAERDAKAAARRAFNIAH